jgi:hypothetical protein
MKPVDAVSSLGYKASKAWSSECKRRKVWLHFVFNTISGTEETGNKPGISTKDLPNTKTTTFGSKDICIMRINRTLDRTTIQTTGQVPKRLLHKHGTGLRLYQNRVATDVSGCHFSRPQYGTVAVLSCLCGRKYGGNIDVSTDRHGLSQRFGFFRLPRGLPRRIELQYHQPIHLL